MGRRGDPAKDLQQLVAKVVNGLLNVAERLDDFRTAFQQPSAALVRVAACFV